MKANTLPLNTRSKSDTQKGRRWWLYGLLALGALILLAAVGFMGLLGYYTSKKPVPIAHVDITPADQEALTGRWVQFQQEIKEGQPTAPFKLSAHELNGFFSTVPSLNDRVYLGLTGNTARAEVSFPLEGLLPVFGKGRYLNAVETLRLRPGPDGIPQPEVLSVTVNGNPLPRWVARRIGQREFTRDPFGPLNDPSFRSQIKSIEIRDGCLLLTPVNAR